MTMDPKKTELTSLFYSVGIHVIIVSFLLTLPLSKGEVRLQSFSELIVYPQAERGDALPAAPPAPKAVVPRISHVQRAETKPVQKRGEEHVKRQGKTPAADLTMKKAGGSRTEAANAPGREAAVASQPARTSPAETKSIETKSVEVQPAPAAPAPVVPEVAEETGTELLTEEDVPEAGPEEGKNEGTVIEENTERKPDIAAKTTPAEKPPVPIIAEKSINRGIMSKMMPVQPKTVADEAAATGDHTKNTEKKPDIAARTQPGERALAPVIAENTIRMANMSRLMRAEPATNSEEAGTEGEKREKGLDEKSSAAGESPPEPGSEKGPPPPSLLKALWQDIALSSPAPGTTPLRGVPSEEGTSAAKPAAGATGQMISGGKRPETAGKETEGKKNKAGVARPGLGIPLSEALLSKGVKIEVLLDAAGDPAVEMRLIRKPYPSAAGRKISQARKEVATKQESEKLDVAGTARVKRSVLVENAEKGIYTFVMENNAASACEADLSFVFYKGGRKERTKKYAAVKISGKGAARFKFLFPDMIFWDDEDAFTGSIEDSDSLTKFNSDTGLLWKEEKNERREDAAEKGKNRE